MRNLKKIFNFLKGYLPMNQKTYLKDLKNISVVLNALVHAEAQHAQIELKLVQDVAALNAGKSPTNAAPKSKSNDPSYM